MGSNKYPIIGEGEQQIAAYVVTCKVNANGEYMATFPGFVAFAKSESDALSELACQVESVSKRIRLISIDINRDLNHRESKPVERYWCQACGAYGDEACSIVGHRSEQMRQTRIEQGSKWVRHEPPKVFERTANGNLIKMKV